MRIAQLPVLIFIDACVMFIIAPRHVGFCAGGAAARGLPVRGGS